MIFSSICKKVSEIFIKLLESVKNKFKGFVKFIFDFLKVASVLVFKSEGSFLSKRWWVDAGMVILL